MIFLIKKRPVEPTTNRLYAVFLRDFFNENFVQVSLAPSVEWLDAYSEIYTDTAEADIGVVSDDDDVDGDATLKAMGNCGQVLNNNKG